MECWENIIHTALLGTDKKQLKKEDFPEALAETFETINQPSADNEMTFLSMAAVVLNYRKCGAEPLHKILDYSKAEVEEKVYGSATAHQLLSDIIAVENIALLKTWLQLCVANNRIVQPEWVPVLLDLGTKHKPLQHLLLAATGKRGEWLLSFNEGWKIEPPMADEELWQTGTLEQRKNFLRKRRATNPEQARGLLQQAWAQENAVAKTELLKTLIEGISNDDAAWLEQALTDKSTKVRDEAMRLLKRIPQSSIVQQYWEVVQQSVHIKKEKGLFGIGGKTILNIQLTTAIAEQIFTSGIEKISSQKNISDSDFVLYQLIAAVPPHFFEAHFGMFKQDILSFLSKSKTASYFVAAFGQAAITFKEPAWLKAVMEVQEKPFYLQAFELLPKEEVEAYTLQLLERAEHAPAVIDQLTKGFKEEWSMALTRAVFKHTAKNQYSYYRSFYDQAVLSIPAGISPELESFLPTEEYMRNMWMKTSSHIRQILTLKIQTLQAFHS